MKTSSLTAEQKKELEKRLELHYSGKQTYYTIDQVKKAIAKAIKKKKHIYPAAGSE